MPKFSFKRTPEGWAFKSAYPRIFGQPSTYLLTDAEKAALEERLKRVVLRSRVLVFISWCCALWLCSWFATLYTDWERTRLRRGCFCGSSRSSSRAY